MSQIVQMKPKTSFEKKTKTVVDTLMITPELVDKWKAPAFQRPLRENRKVIELSEKMKIDGGVIPGVITLGVLGENIYLLDGQHRVAAFKLSGLSNAYVDIRKHYFETMAEMGNEWVLLNSALVRMTPDDILRGIESGSEVLQLIRKRCPFVGYNYVRRGPQNALMSMSSALRCWRASQSDIPSNATGCSGQVIAETMDLDDADTLCNFLTIAREAFGDDAEYGRLWGALNITICMWLYRRMVVTQWSPRIPRLTIELFRKCLTHLSTSEDYLAWLVGRLLSERDRSPAYMRIRNLFTDRLNKETGKRTMMPSPAWFHAK